MFQRQRSEPLLLWRGIRPSQKQRWPAIRKFSIHWWQIRGKVAQGKVETKTTDDVGHVNVGRNEEKNGDRTGQHRHPAGLRFLNPQ